MCHIFILYTIYLNILFFPFPNFFYKIFSSYIMTCLLFLSPKFLFNHHLSSNTCMITTWIPQCCTSFHTIPCKLEKFFAQDYYLQMIKLQYLSKTSYIVLHFYVINYIFLYNVYYSSGIILPSCNSIFYSISQSMSKVKKSSYIRRRYHHDKLSFRI